MAAPDMTVVTAALDFASVVGSVLGVAASFVSLYVVIKGAAIVVRAVYGDSGDRYWDGYTAEDDSRDRASAGMDKR